MEGIEKITFIKKHYGHHISEYDLTMDLLDGSLYETNDLAQLVIVSKAVLDEWDVEEDAIVDNIKEAISDWKEVNC